MNDVCDVERQEQKLSGTIEKASEGVERELGTELVAPG